MHVDFDKVRRESVRWLILLTLNHARPMGHGDRPIKKVVEAMYHDTSIQEVRKELDYLELRKLVEIKKQPNGEWHCTLTRYGIDMADYTIDCEPGIARPEKYWV